MAILAATVAPRGARRALPIWRVRDRIEILSSEVENSYSFHELLFFFVERLRVRGLFEGPGVLGAGFFRQKIVRAAPGTLVTPLCFAFSCQPLRVCGYLDLDDGEGRRELSIVKL